MESDHRYKENAKDECYCPNCGLRRVLWPLHQDVSSWRDPKALWVHVNGLSICLL